MKGLYVFFVFLQYDMIGIAIKEGIPIQTIKMLCSDYDRTLKINGKISKETALKIREFQSLNHLFVINTGRSYHHLMEDLGNHDISYDFIISGSGSQIYDAHGSCLSHVGITKTAVLEVIEALQHKDVSYVFICGPEGRKGFAVQDLKLEDLAFLSAINSMSTRFQTEEEAEQFSASLNRRGHVNAFANRLSVDIAPPQISKASGIAKLASYLNIHDDNIYTIGYSLNDLPMLKAYQGACVSVSHPQLIQDIPHQFEGVLEYLEEILVR